jgi:hypothetical protein
MTNTVYNKECQYLGAQAKPCGCTSVAHKSYCAEHVWLVYKEGSNILRKKDTKRYSQLQIIVDDFNAVLEELEAEGWTVEWDGSVQ